MKKKIKNALVGYTGFIGSNLIHVKKFCIYNEHDGKITDEAFHKNLWTLPNIQKIYVQCWVYPTFDLDLEQLCIQHKHSSTLQEVTVWMETSGQYFNCKINEEHPTLESNGYTIIFLNNIPS